MARKPSLRERLGYRFDTFMSKGTLSLIGGLTLVTLIVIGLAALVIALGGITLSPEADPPEAMGPLEAAWSGLMHSIDSGALGGDAGWGFRIVMLLVTIMGIFIFSTLIGVLTAGVEGKLEQLRKGRSRVLESGHTVILGWSSQIYTIVRELAQANANQRRPCVTILAERDKVEMEEELRDRVGTTGKTRVICRSGSTIDPGDISLVSPDQARSIIILPPEEDDPDSFVIKTVLALTNAPGRKRGPYVIVTQIREAENLELVKMISARDKLSAVLARDLIARVTAQTSRQSGLSVVYTELLDFGGDEIYFSSQSALEGRAYGECLNCFPDSTLMGIFTAEGQAILNPPMERRLAKDDRFVVLAADDDRIRMEKAGSAPDLSARAQGGAVTPAAPEKCLILNWNPQAQVIARELDAYVSPGSLITVVAGEDTAPRIEELRASLVNQRLDFHPGDPTHRALLEEIGVKDYDHVICLAQEGLEVQRADARTLVTLLHLRDMAEKDETPFSIVSEMLDLRNRELAEAAKVDDFIVSDHLVSLMMSQLSENHDLFGVFADLFDPEGAEIYLKPATDYLKPGVETSWAAVVELARQRGQTALGYRLHAQARDAQAAYGVHTNPAKALRLTLGRDDRIIVLAED